ncbi:23S rRNA (cytosine1962-C5)-methyltransferase [Eubacterium ruminantium]|nr:23S rRNA (cytosine1962-C5)-methyltransferase [Eubacterium ruminantium]
MWIAENWKDYEILDTSKGEKLERWADYILLRPDPQVLWNTPRKIKEWKSLNGHYHRSEKGGGSWEFFDLPEEWTIKYSLPKIDSETAGFGTNGKDTLTFHLKPFSFKHTGLFPEQAVNWDWTYSLIKKRIKEKGDKVKVLNLFAYTGGATLAAAAAGAAVTHVDASKGMVGWAKENAASSGLSDAPIRWLVDDCKKFVEREIRRGNKYEGIIMDPPSYGRGPKGEIWKMEDSIYELVQLTAKLLSDDPLFFLINSYTTGLAPSVLTYIMSTEIIPNHGGRVESSEIGLPVTASKLVLPCGASGRWMK